MQQWILAIVPSLLCSLVLLYITKQGKREEIREATRTKNNVLIMKGVYAALALGDATAHAIENKSLNGEMKIAREYAKITKQEIELFMLEQCSKNI